MVVQRKEVPKNLMAVDLKKVLCDDPEIKGATDAIIDTDQNEVEMGRCYLFVDMSTQEPQVFRIKRFTEKPPKTYNIIGRVTQTQTVSSH